MIEPELVKATVEHVKAFEPTLRDEELMELGASGILKPMEHLLERVGSGDPSFAILYKGAVGAMLGVAPLVDSVLAEPEVGQVWFLTGWDFQKRPKAYLRIARPVVALLLNVYPVLVNCIDARYVGALQLAALLGASFDSPVPLGPEGRLFIPFALRRH